MSSTHQTRSKTATTAMLNNDPKAMFEEPLTLSTDESSLPTPVLKKRKRTLVQKKKLPVVDPTSEASLENSSSSKKKTNPSPGKDKNEEKRLRVFRKRAPQSYLEKLHRATSQRMFVIDRIHGGTDDVPEETIEMAGTTGNIYHVYISHLPSCTCPDNQKGNQCKHIVYVLHNVLKAPEHLQYQLAFISSELREIFSHAPTPPSSFSSPFTPSNRKPISGDCPICFTEFAPTTEEIVWCRAACGNNIHKDCFEQWARTRARGVEVTCVYCRTPWQKGDEESVRMVKGKGKVNGEGYVNVGGELGLSGERDYSTYHPYWVRRQFGEYY